MSSVGDRRTGQARRSPSFGGLNAATSQASRIKQRNRKRDSRAELALRKALWKRGWRYRVHVAGLPGNPDIVFTKLRTVVFVDGDFWHGRDWEKRKAKLARGANSDYWLRKIAYNRERDRKVTTVLEEMGWIVLRIWETDINRDVVHSVASVERALAGRGWVGP